MSFKEELPKFELKTIIDIRSPNILISECNKLYNEGYEMIYDKEFDLLIFIKRGY